MRSGGCTGGKNSALFAEPPTGWEGKDVSLAEFSLYASQ